MSRLTDEARIARGHRTQQALPVLEEAIEVVRNNYVNLLLEETDPDAILGLHKCVATVARVHLALSKMVIDGSDATALTEYAASLAKADAS